MSEFDDLPRVIKVLDAYKAVINVGADHDVEKGDSFVVFGSGGMLTDPVTGEELGELEIVRGRARAVHVQQRITTVESIEFDITPGKTRRVKRSGGTVFALSLGAGPEVEEIVEGEEKHQAGLDAELGDFARPI